MRWLLSTRDVEGITIIDIIRASIYLGESYRELQDAVKDILGEGKKNLLLNLTNVQVMDSSGMGDLITCHTTAQNQGAAFKLLNPATRVHDLLKITRLSTIFEIFFDEDEALRSFAGKTLEAGGGRT